MPDYVLTKIPDRKTGQLPDRLTIVLQPRDAWLLVKQLMIQLEQCNQQVRTDVYGLIEKLK